jgi:APA family basic amino acid/polyamine antiporter
MRRQLFACKSIDRLISDSEHPRQRLAKSLGPWSLTALGIGAIIGSGIFVLTGTAAAGEHFAAPSLLHAQVMDLVVSLVQHGNLSGALLHGRPPAGPAIAVSFILVAVACSFAGLCYVELASMIPIAGSAYTYSYATLGELFAWVIGWDLILEYVVGNVAVAVGFAGYFKAQLSSFGLDMPDRWSTPVWAEGQMTGAYFNLPAFLIIFFLTLLLVRGVRESASANNIMVVVKIAAIVTFLVVGGMLVNPVNWHPFAPSGFRGIVTGGAIVFFTYIGFDVVSTAAEESVRPQRDMPIGIIASLVVCAVLYVGVALVLLGMLPYATLCLRAGGGRAGGLRPQGAWSPSRVSGDNSHRCDGRNGLLPPRLPVRTGAHLVFDVPRPPPAGILFRAAPAISNALLVHLDRLRGGGHPGGPVRHRRRG